MKKIVSTYKAQFIAIPDPLKKQIWIRLGFALAFLLLLILVLLAMFDWMAVVPVIFLMIYSVTSAVLLFSRAVAGKYVVIRGRCVEVAVTPIRKRCKSFLVQTDTHLIRLVTKQRSKRIPTGMELEIYVANHTPVYEKDGAKLLHTYLAIHIIHDLGTTA